VEVELYLAGTDLPVAERDRLARLLDDDETARAARFRREADRTRFVARRGILREVLARRLGEDAARLRFEHGPFGKPAIVGGGINFSLAHSDGQAMIALCDVEVGCDLERVDPSFQWRPVARGFFAKGERDCLFRMPRTAGTHLFFDWWARKEALVKALGRGLSHELDRIDLSVTSTRAFALGEQWLIEPVAALPGFAAALAVPSRSGPIRVSISG
jgi:4'-phosphopantetheinyl transferase